MKRMLLAALALMAIWSFNACSDSDMFRELNAQKELSATTVADGASMGVNTTLQWKANEKYSLLVSSFDAQNNLFQKGIPVYPDYYGGAYVTPDGNLIVLIKGDVDIGSKAVRSVIGAEQVRFKEADYSFAELTDIMDKLNEFVISRKNPTAQKNFNIFSLMDQQNRVVVELNEYSEAKIAEFKAQVLNSPAIEFVQSKGQMELQANLQPGCKAEMNIAGTDFFSFGFRARRVSDNAVGMVTAGHAIGVGQTLYYGGIAIGTCSDSQVSGTVDAAFIPISNPLTYSPSNTLCGTADVLSAITFLPAPGTSVSKIGAATNLTFGNVINTNTTWIDPVSGNILTNITSAGYNSSIRDSGGIVFYKNPSTGVNYTVGTHIGDLAGTRYYTKANQILTHLGLVRY